MLTMRVMLAVLALLALAPGLSAKSDQYKIKPASSHIKAKKYKVKKVKKQKGNRKSVYQSVSQRSN